MTALYCVELTAAELLLLDGQCSAATQQAVNLARDAQGHLFSFQHHPNGEALSRFVAEAVAEARKNKKLIFQHAAIGSCPICKKSAGYATYKRGRDRGRPNYDKPHVMSGYELQDSFVRISRHVSLGGCVECVDLALPFLREQLVGVEAQLPEKLRGEGADTYTRHRRVKCNNCQWEGHEGLMTKSRTLMNDGWYPSGCPECKTTNPTFGPDIVVRVDGFELVKQETRTP